MIFDASAPCDLDALHAQALELVLRRAGLRTLALTPAIELSRLGRALRALEPAAVVLTGRRVSLDSIGRLVYAVRSIVREVAVFDYRGAVPDTGASTVCRLGRRARWPRATRCSTGSAAGRARRRGRRRAPPAPRLAERPRAGARRRRLLTAAGGLLESRAHGASPHRPVDPRASFPELEERGARALARARRVRRVGPPPRGRAAVGLLRGPADGQRPAGHPPRAGARVQGHLPPLPDDARALRRAQGRLGLPRPAGRARGRGGARVHLQGRHRALTGSPSSTPAAASRCSATSRTGTG